MILPKYFISCDWGTTNFRLRVIETISLQVLVEHTTNQGVRAVYDQFLEQNQLNRFLFFKTYLTAQIKCLPQAHQRWPLVLSGMASSNIGVKELPYASLPIHQDGRNLIWDKIVLGRNQEAFLISGVRHEVGMMRGEEVQAIGLANYMQSFSEGILILPGTHSKHLTYQKDHFTDLKTYMTGELFNLFTKKSILAHSVVKSLWHEKYTAAFIEGIQYGIKDRLSGTLFLVRAKQILQATPPQENYYFLSGLLIGDELSYLKNNTSHIFLAAPKALSHLYHLALKSIIAPNQFTLFNNEILTTSLLLGQKKVLSLS